MEETKHAASVKHELWTMLHELLFVAGMWAISWWMRGHPPSWVMSILIVVVSACVVATFESRLTNHVRATLFALLFTALALVATPLDKPGGLVGVWLAPMIAAGLSPYIPKNRKTSDPLPVITVYLPLVIAAFFVLVIYLTSLWVK